MLTIPSSWQFSLCHKPYKISLSLFNNRWMSLPLPLAAVLRLLWERDDVIISLWRTWLRHYEKLMLQYFQHSYADWERILGAGGHFVCSYLQSNRDGSSNTFMTFLWRHVGPVLPEVNTELHGTDWELHTYTEVVRTDQGHSVRVKAYKRRHRSHDNKDSRRKNKEQHTTQYL
jgi:hypothetical protein